MSRGFDYGAARSKAKSTDSTIIKTVANDSPKPDKEARTYTRAELRHDRWRTATLASVFSFTAGIVATSFIAFFWASWGQETASKRAVETFAQGVAVGQVVGTDPDDKGVSPRQTGRAGEPADAPLP
jgi:hypothetical protein